MIKRIIKKAGKTLKISGQTIKVLYESSRRYFFLTILLSILVGLTTPLTSWIWKSIIDCIAILISSAEKTQIQSLFFWIIIYFVIQIISSIVARLNEYTQTIYSEYVDLSIKKKILKILTRLQLKDFDDYHIHNSIAKASQESTSRSMGLLRTILQSIQYGTSILGSIFLLINFKAAIILLIFLSAIPSFFVNLKISDKLFDIYNSRLEKIRNAKAIQNLMTHGNNMKEIKVYRVSKYLKDKILNIYKDCLEQDKKIRGKIFLINFSTDLYQNVFTVVVKCLIILISIKQGRSIGDITMYINSIDNLKLSTLNIMSLLSNVYENTLYLKSVLKLEEFVNMSKYCKKNQPITSLKKIKFINVSFKYPGSSNYALKNINLELEENKNYALVGLNGSGKTTFIKLLLGLYTPTQGKILINEINLQDLDLETYYRYVSAVFQDFVKYPFDIETNIAVGDIEIADETDTIVKAAKFSGIDEYIQKLPDKYKSVLGREWNESVDLSEGQWQKIAIARAFMKKSDLVILDEPTAALDAMAEYEIFSKFNLLSKGKICIYVTHRLSNIISSDTVFVFKDGRIVESGSHDNLLMQNGLYKTMYNLQSSAYK